MCILTTRYTHIIVKGALGSAPAERGQQQRGQARVDSHMAHRLVYVCIYIIRCMVH